MVLRRIGVSVKAKPEFSGCPVNVFLCALAGIKGRLVALKATLKLFPVTPLK